MAEDDHGFDTEFQAVRLSTLPFVPECNMGSSVSSFPPLGQVTQLKSEKVSFIALLEVEQKDKNARERDLWEVAIWYSSGNGDWEEQSMSSVAHCESLISLQTLNPSSARLHFTVTLPVSSSLKFTLKYRNGPDQPWIWAHQEQGIADGVVLMNPESNASQQPSSLSHVIYRLNPDLRVRSVASQTPRTQLWTVEARIGPAEDDCSTYADVELGIPWGGFMRYFALVRHSSPWLGPRQGKGNFDVDQDAVVSSFLSSEGKHLVLLGISGVDNVITLLRGTDSQMVKIHIRSDSDTQSAGLVLASVGDNFESAMAAVMYHARNVVLATSQANEEISEELRALSDDVKPEWMENWYDGLGYCTWNALGQRLTDEKLLNAVDSLAQNNINITSLIIDDNWQDIDYHGPNQYGHGWKSFEAEPKAFPSGLKDTVSKVRSKHSSIQHVAVWHALLGYWGGISPEGELAKKYKTLELARDDAGLNSPMIAIAKEDVDRFYDDFYRFLSDCGIDGVKTDVQYMLDTLSSAKGRRDLTNTYLDAWMISALRHFSIKAISCMSQAPQILFHQQLPRNRPVMLVRNSDDFFPDVLESHPWHIWANAHNSLLTQHLNILPDWDMFQTAHEFAGFHAAARCLSGGPIYITDVPGQHNIDLINEMTGPTPRGKTVIFRPSVLGKTIDPYTGYDENLILKIGSYHGRAITGTPILGLFNIKQRYLKELIPLYRFPGVTSSMKYIVRSHRSGMVSPVLQPGFSQALLAVALNAWGYDILSAFAVTQFYSETNGRIYTANLGLIGKMTGSAAITSNKFELFHTGRVFVDTSLKALGVLGLYISSLPDMSIDRDFMVTIQGQPIPAHTVTLDRSDNRVLAIDVETAWNEMGLQSGWSNEVEVKIYFDIEHP